MTEKSNTFNIADIFNLKTSTKTDMIEYNAVNNVNNIDDITNQDIKYSRDNITNIIEKGSMALDELINLASQSQQFKAYDSITTMMKVLLDANKDLISIHKDNKAINKASETVEGKPKTINNTLFVGSTEELAKMMEEKKKKNDS